MRAHKVIKAADGILNCGVIAPRRARLHEVIKRRVVFLIEFIQRLVGSLGAQHRHPAFIKHAGVRRNAKPEKVLADNVGAEAVYGAYVRT